MARRASASELQLDLSSELQQPAARAVQERRYAVSDEEVLRQRARTSWSLNLRPTMDGLEAGAYWGAITGSVGSLAIYALHRQSTFVRNSSTAGKVWLACVAGMAGFFINSEQAVVGTDARARDASRKQNVR